MSSKLDRREFVKRTVAGGVLLSSNTHGSLIQSSLADSNDDPLYQGFTDPPAQARPFYRWWWNGNRVTAEEIKRELQLMAESGAGGVEINPIRLDKEIYPDAPGKPLDWLSDEWNQMVKTAADEGQKRGMLTDLIVGTGWPFGGRFLDPEETIQGLELETRPVKDSEQSININDIFENQDKKLIQLKLIPQPLHSLDDITDLTHSISDKGEVKLPSSAAKSILHIVTWRNRFRDVMHGAPGGDGPVLDHFNKNAVLKYLNRMSSRLNPVFGGKMGNQIRSLFCDSIELEGANWTNDFSDVFNQRRGYAVEPYLPMIMNTNLKVAGEMRDTLRRVRYDHALTLAELFMERFIIPYHQWCNKNGTQSRYQAYGHPWLYTDLLEGYLIPDIPEGDQWLFNRGWVRGAVLDDIRYGIWNKYTSSAAHLMGRPIASSEAMTNTRGVFKASLEYIKQATDINIATGINHLVLHGFNYSPPEAAFPGWIRYGTYFNEHNPWWPHTKLWADYAARLSWVFQQSKPVSQVAILGPTPDVWSEHGLNRNPWNTTPWYVHELWQAINHHGYFADYVNATILQKGRCEQGELRVGDMRYQILLVANVESLSPATAKAIAQLAKKGLQVVFIGTMPSRSPGLTNKETNDAIVKQSIEEIINDFDLHTRMVSEPKGDTIVQWAGLLLRREGIKPAVQISNPDPKLFFIHQQYQDRDVYFFSNMDRERTIKFETIFPTGEKTPWVWNAETGERTVYPHGTWKNQLSINLEPIESLLLVFEAEMEGPTLNSIEIEDTPLLTIEGPWDVEFNPVAGEPFTRTLPTLIDLSKDETLKTFSGTLTYTTTFEMDKDIKALLDAGTVHETAEAYINGIALGIRWWGQRQFEIAKELKAGTNELKIVVTTLINNYCLSLKDNAAVQLWCNRHRNPEHLPTGLFGPVQVYRIE